MAKIQPVTISANKSIKTGKLYNISETVNLTYNDALKLPDRQIIEKGVEWSGIYTDNLGNQTVLQKSSEPTSGIYLSFDEREPNNYTLVVPSGLKGKITLISSYVYLDDRFQSTVQLNIGEDFSQTHSDRRQRHLLNRSSKFNEVKNKYKSLQ